MKNKVSAGLLALFLGGIGVHKFYLNRPVQGFIYLIFCWTFIPWFLGVIEGIMYLVSDDKSFNAKYNPTYTATPQKVEVTRNTTALSLGSMADEMKKIIELKEKGIITEEEYEQLKQKILR